MAYNLLLVEDDSQIREVIEDFFSDKSDGNIRITSAANGTEGLLLAESQEFDLVLLDVMLPGIDGFSICRSLRARSDVPILFLTARGREDDILYGYELGCDDYIVKPFLLSELYAKVYALLRRAKGMVTVQLLTCGGIVLNPRTYCVTANGEEVALAPKEYALLKYLLEHKTWVVDRETLLVRIWGNDYYGSDRVVDNHIKKLRKSLGSCGKQIRTVVTKGYQLID